MPDLCMTWNIPNDCFIFFFCRIASPFLDMLDELLNDEEDIEDSDVTEEEDEEDIEDRDITEEEQSDSSDTDYRQCINGQWFGADDDEEEQKETHRESDKDVEEAQSEEEAQKSDSLLSEGDEVDDDD